ncbi:hypothetical protein FNF31_06580 [Cafeteria roenbergensis]|uniref:Uncharacterized protein n=1 Tax=Cafeteria roenbergensis TaxID=33653 RepID=A0A5A8CI53_CAFRO|nr:hypothetical protein FNF31_06580 [Cafeteria roenbergensis]
MASDLRESEHEVAAGDVVERTRLLGERSFYVVSRMVDPVEPAPNKHWAMVRRLGAETRRVQHSPEVRVMSLSDSLATTQAVALATAWRLRKMPPLAREVPPPGRAAAGSSASPVGPAGAARGRAADGAARQRFQGTLRFGLCRERWRWVRASGQAAGLGGLRIMYLVDLVTAVIRAARPLRWGDGVVPRDGRGLVRGAVGAAADREEGEEEEEDDEEEGEVEDAGEGGDDGRSGAGWAELVRMVELSGTLAVLPGLLRHVHSGARAAAGRLLLELSQARWMRTALLVAGTAEAAAEGLEAPVQSFEEARAALLDSSAYDSGSDGGEEEEDEEDDDGGEEEEEEEEEEGNGGGGSRDQEAERAHEPGDEDEDASDEDDEYDAPAAAGGAALGDEAAASPGRAATPEGGAAAGPARASGGDAAAGAYSAGVRWSEAEVDAFGSGYWRVLLAPATLRSLARLLAEREGASRLGAMSVLATALEAAGHRPCADPPLGQEVLAEDAGGAMAGPVAGSGPDWATVVASMVARRRGALTALAAGLASADPVLGPAALRLTHCVAASSAAARRSLLRNGFHRLLVGACAQVEGGSPGHALALAATMLFADPALPPPGGFAEEIVTGEVGRSCVGLVVRRALRLVSGEGAAAAAAVVALTRLGAVPQLLRLVCSTGQGSAAGADEDEDDEDDEDDDDGDESDDEDDGEDDEDDEGLGVGGRRRRGAGIGGWGSR